jgi:hypothetical protein
MSKNTHSRIERLEQAGRSKQAKRIVVVGDRSEVPAGLESTALVIVTGVTRGEAA